MKIALIGYGKMGKTIEQIALAAGHEIVLKIDADNLDQLTPAHLQKADVAIEFSRPESAADNLLLCMQAGVPAVSGTTAWLDRKPEVDAACQAHHCAFLYASNFSIGVNLFFALNRYLADKMQPFGEYDPVLEEIHHTQKLDAPSGTGITLAEGILERLTRKTQWVNRAAQTPEELALTSVRVDPAPGTHTVAYHSDVDSIEIKHTAHSRLGFAQGALHAAEWIVGKQGLFTMKDVLGF